MSSIWRDKCRFGYEEGARDGASLGVVCDTEVSVSVSVVCANARERGEDDTVGERHVADLNRLEKSRHWFREFSHLRIARGERRW